MLDSVPQTCWPDFITSDNRWFWLRSNCDFTAMSRRWLLNSWWSILAFFGGRSWWFYWSFRQLPSRRWCLRGDWKTRHLDTGTDGATSTWYPIQGRSLEVGVWSYFVVEDNGNGKKSEVQNVVSFCRSSWYVEGVYFAMMPHSAHKDMQTVRFRSCCYFFISGKFYDISPCPTRQYFLQRIENMKLCLRIF